jgi:type II secretory pathway component PulJ
VLTARLLRLRARLRDERGVGLIELLVSLMLIGVIVAAWSSLTTATVKSNGRTQELATLGTEVRAAVDTLAADLREAQCNGTTKPVTTSTTTQLTFYSPDRLTPFHLRQVSYRLSGGQLQRAIATSTDNDGAPWSIPALGAWTTMLGSVTNTSIFTYKNADGAATTTPTNVASATVTLIVTPSKGIGGASSTSQTTIDLRTASCET